MVRDSPVEEGQEVVVAPPVEAPHPLTVFQDNWRGRPPSRLLPQGQKILMGRMGQACCDNPVWHGFNRNPGAFPHIFFCDACGKFFVRNWVYYDRPGQGGGTGPVDGNPPWGAQNIRTTAQACDGGGSPAAFSVPGAWDVVRPGCHPHPTGKEP